MFYDLAQLQNRVAYDVLVSTGVCALYTVPYMILYAHMTYVYIVRIASVSDCISMLRLTELHVKIPTWQQSYIAAPCPTPTPAFLLPT